LVLDTLLIDIATKWSTWSPVRWPSISLKF
jgi:hypothetical protein